MKIKIPNTENYYIEIDNLGNRTLYKKMITKTEKNKGNEYVVALGYYPSIERALLSYIDDSLIDKNGEEAIELKEYIRQHKELVQSVLDIKYKQKR